MTILFDTLFTDPQTGETRVAFGIYDESSARITELVVNVPSGEYKGGVNGVIAEAHQMVTDILRQWLYVTDKMRQAYAKHG